MVFMAQRLWMGAFQSDMFFDAWQAHNKVNKSDFMLDALTLWV